MCQKTSVLLRCLLFSVGLVGAAAIAHAAPAGQNQRLSGAHQQGESLGHHQANSHEHHQKHPQEGAHGHHHGHHHAPSPEQQQITEALFQSAVPAQDISIERCWLRLVPASLPAAGYFEVHNHQAEPVELVAVRSSSYEEAMLHQTYEEDGLSKMGAADDLWIPAGQHLSFEPGGYHAMFETPTQALSVGEQVEMEFLFKRGATAEQKKVMCRVLPAKARHYDE